MYKVNLQHDDKIIASAESKLYTDAAELAIDAMPAMFLAVPKDVSLQISKDGEHLFSVPLSAHLAVIKRFEMAA